MEDTDLTSGGAKLVSYIRVTMENFHVFANLHFSYIHFPLKMKWIKDRYRSNLLTERIQKILKKNWLPNSDSRICSNHFVDSTPTLKNPYPTLNLGHSHTVSAPRKPPKTREITLKKDTPAKKPKTEPSNCGSQTIAPSSLNVSTTVSHDHDYDYCQCSSCITKDAEIKKLRAQITKLSVENKSLKSKLLKRIDQPFGFEDLRTDEQIRFYTGIPSVQTFEAILSVIKPYLSKVH